MAVKVFLFHLRMFPSFSLSFLPHHYPGMATHTLENILQTKCMVLEFTGLPKDIDTRVLGMKEEGKALVYTLSEMGRRSQAIGKMEFSVFLPVQKPLLGLPCPLLTPEFLTQYR